MKRLSVSLLTAFFVLLVANAAAPADYYKTCENKSGKALLQALCSKIGSHTNVGYDGLWNVYKTSDVRANGTVWDMYSTKEWAEGKQRCGNYKNVGDCINREHSFPKSWFSEGSPMKSDAFHVYPTDGKVNGQRSNFPYGECSGGTTLPSNGNVKALGKLGTSTFPGYSGKVFEPVDEYKGDFARSYFYMAACYNDKISGWNSDMLAHNNYPVFSSWAINLLLKWHRQDPVSEKEIKRNDAVYNHQHNRNPFIDHPELAEYIWGDKKDQGWVPGGAKLDPVITAPADGSTFDIGITGLGIERSRMVAVRGSNITENVTVTVSGTGFSVSTTKIDASAVNNNRAGVVVTFVSNQAKTATGTLTLVSGKARSTVKLTASAVSGLPAAPATDISETSFMAHWTNVDGDGAMYDLMLYLNGEPVAGYPERVPAEDEEYLVEGLEPGSDYSYTLSNGTLTSNVVKVRTAEPIPSINFLYDGELEFLARPGEPSEVAELLLDVENITGDIKVTVTAPFEVSTDKSSWSRSVTIAEGEDRMYLRLNGTTEGTYETTLTAVAGDYVSDDAEAKGVIMSEVTFLETFDVEKDGFKNGYDNGSFNGVMCEWNMVDVGVYESDKNYAYQGSGVCRFGKKATSSIATATPKAGGAGTVSFFAKPWTSEDGDATIKVQYSTDGDSWTDAGSVVVTGNNYVEQSVDVKQGGYVYIRLQQTTGKRVFVDNVKISDYSGVGGVEELYYHSWDAYCRAGSLVIENKQAGDRFSIYGMDGIEYFNSALPAGEAVVNLSKGLYIVVSGDFSRRVLVK